MPMCRCQAPGSAKQQIVYAGASQQRDCKLRIKEAKWQRVVRGKERIRHNVEHSFRVSKD